MSNLIPAYPEIFLTLMIMTIMVVDLYLKDEQRCWTHALSIFTLLGTAVLSGAYLMQGETFYLFNGMFVSDALSNLLKLCAALALLFIFMMSRQYTQSRAIYKGEFYTLSLFALLGQMVMISANNFIIVYLGLEMMSLSLYALVALRRDHVVASEAAMKYFVLGALASGFILYGISMVYGATGGLLNFPEMAYLLNTQPANDPLLVLGLVFIIAGLAFKFGAVPFHMWVPDVYQGAPTVVTLLIGAAPKLAAFAIAFRILIEGMIYMSLVWQDMLIVLAVLSLVVGNLVAIAQKNLKRMLAYSTISHMGFVLLGLTAGVVNNNLLSAPHAYSAALFYVITYVLTTLGTFGMILLLSRADFEAEELSDLKGLHKRSPWYAFLMLILMFSLAGVPPTVGFQAKLVVLQEVVNAGHVWLAVVAVMTSLIGAFYYLRVVKLMYFDEPTDTQPLTPRRDLHLALSTTGVAALLLGLLPGPLLTLCLQVIDITLRS
ncbi:MAG: NADH-quinone oxidoreductase subunit NuoN [Burkholderiaceae bacterium]|nr:MAG: NADH-quinone oxidoreductase subunit NuoN [Burkholderiaceae bacterium]